MLALKYVDVTKNSTLWPNNFMKYQFKNPAI